MQRLLFKLLWHPAASWHLQQSVTLWKGHISARLSHPLLQNKAKLKAVMSSPEEVAGKIRIKSHIRKPFLQAVLYSWMFSESSDSHCRPAESALAFLHTHLLFHRRLLQVCMVCFCWTLCSDSSWLSSALFVLSSLRFCLYALCKSVSVLSKNLVRTENNISLISVSSCAQNLLVPIGFLTGYVPMWHENTLRRFMSHFCIQDWNEELSDDDGFSTLPALCSIGYVHNPTLKLLAWLIV